MLFHEFLNKLKKCNPKFLVKYHNRSRTGMIYVYKPSHELSNPDGTYECCGFPSPAFYPGIPAYNFIDLTGRKTRGWHKVIQILVEQGHITHSNAHKYFPNWNIYGGNPVEPSRKVEELPKVETHTGIHKMADNEMAIKSR